MIFSEDSRVKISCILHLVRLGYRYLSLRNAVWDEATNIFPELLKESAWLEQEIKKQLAGLRYE